MIWIFFIAVCEVSPSAGLSKSYGFNVGSVNEFLSLFRAAIAVKGIRRGLVAALSANKFYAAALICNGHGRPAVAVLPDYPSPVSHKIHVGIEK